MIFECLLVVFAVISLAWLWWKALEPTPRNTRRQPMELGEYQISMYGYGPHPEDEEDEDDGWTAVHGR